MSLLRIDSTTVRTTVSPTTPAPTTTPTTTPKDTTTENPIQTSSETSGGTHPPVVAPRTGHTSDASMEDCFKSNLRE